MIEGVLSFDERIFQGQTIDFRITADSGLGEQGDPAFHLIDEFNEDNNTFLVQGVLLNPVPG